MILHICFNGKKNIFLNFDFKLMLQLDEHNSDLNLKMLFIQF